MINNLKKIKIHIPILVFILHIFVLTSVHSTQPLEDVELIPTHTQIWLGKTILIQNTRKLISVKEYDKKFKKKDLYTFRSRPDLIKHFALADGDLVVAVFNDKQEIIFIVFNSSGNVIYEKKYFLTYEVSEMDVRVDNDGNPLALFYSNRNMNHVVSLWKLNKNQDIINSERPIDRIFLQWSQKRVHLLYRSLGNIYWTVWKDAKYKRYRLPFFIKRPQFFQINGRMYLMGFDVYGNLYKFSIGGNNQIAAQKVSYSKSFQYVDDIIPVKYKKNIILLMPSRKLRKIFRIDFSDFRSARAKTRIQTRNMMTGFYFIPLMKKDGLYFNVVSEINYLYTEPWKIRQPYLYDFEWFIDAESKKPKLTMQWKSSLPGLTYRYLFSNRKNIDPLDDRHKIPGNRIIKENLKSGKYYLHIQAIDGRKKSWLYRIPIFWKYSPSEPYIFLLNEVTPRTIKSGNIEFFINNLDNVDYYASISSVPKEKPIKKINHTKGKISVPAKLKPGRYFLHVRSRDPKSGLYSSTNHFLFFVYPYNPEQDETLKENAEKMGRLQFILQKIRDNSGNPKELKKWMAELRKLKENTKN